MALKELSSHCGFGNFLNDALRDRLVYGLGKESIQKRLLTEAELTFKKACKIAQAMEMADKNASELNPVAAKPGVNALQNPPENNPIPKSTKQQTDETKNCYRCRGLHFPASCRFKTEKCRKCGKTGHIRKKCHTKNVSKGRWKSKKHMGYTISIQ